MIFGSMIKTFVACFVAWLVPGGGHLLLKKWRRGLLFLSVILLLFMLGLSMEGQLFGLTPGLFGLLKFVANASLGVLYLLSGFFGWGKGSIHSYSYEYGNTYLYTAGLMNMLIVLDAFDIAQGRKQ